MMKDVHELIMHDTWTKRKEAVCEAIIVRDDGKIDGIRCSRSSG